jgi:hypothetical protein
MGKTPRHGGLNRAIGKWLLTYRATISYLRNGSAQVPICSRVSCSINSILATTFAVVVPVSSLVRTARPVLRTVQQIVQ